MKPIDHVFDVRAAVAAGDAFNTEDAVDKTVQVSGTFVATLQIEGTIDGSRWDVIASVTTPGLTQVAQSVKKMRINTTAYTSGTPAARMLARDSRTD